MFKGLGNIASLLKQAQNFGPRMEEINRELQAKRVSGAAGGGLVTVQANGLGQILAVEIDPILKERNDLEMITDLLPAAINQAIGKSKALHVESMKSLTGGLPLPGLDAALDQFAGGTLSDALADLEGESDSDKPDRGTPGPAGHPPYPQA